MGDGSGALKYNPELKYAVLGTDQYMLPDSVDGFGGPDGYTRWFNLPEFSTGGMPMFQYTKGKMASSKFAGTATLILTNIMPMILGSTMISGHSSELIKTSTVCSRLDRATPEIITSDSQTPRI